MKDDQAAQQSFMYVLQGFMGLGLIVGIAAVGVIAFRAVVERRQQIGMLRAIGFQRSMVQSAFVLESAIVVMLGVLAGAVFGLILSYSLMTSEAFTEGAPDAGAFIIPWTHDHRHARGVRGRCPADGMDAGAAGVARGSGGSTPVRIAMSRATIDRAADPDSGPPLRCPIARRYLARSLVP